MLCKCDNYDIRKSSVVLPYTTSTPFSSRGNKTRYWKTSLDKPPG